MIPWLPAVFSLTITCASTWVWTFMDNLTAFVTPEYMYKPYTPESRTICYIHTHTSKWEKHTQSKYLFIHPAHTHTRYTSTPLTRYTSTQPTHTLYTSTQPHTHIIHIHPATHTHYTHPPSPHTHYTHPPSPHTHSLYFHPAQTHTLYIHPAHTHTLYIHPAHTLVICPPSPHTHVIYISTQPPHTHAIHPPSPPPQTNTHIELIEAAPVFIETEVGTGRHSESFSCRHHNPTTFPRVPLWPSNSTFPGFHPPEAALVLQVRTVERLETPHGSCTHHNHTFHHTHTYTSPTQAMRWASFTHTHTHTHQHLQLEHEHDRSSSAL